MAGFSIETNLNARGFLNGTKHIENALEDVSDSLDDLAKDAKKDAERIGDSLEDGVADGAKDSEKAVGKLEKSFSDLAKASKKESAKAGDDLGKNVKRGTDEAGEGLNDFKSEANSTARETAASFDGSADSIVGSFQEIAANALAGFGPLGAAAGFAIAGAIGLAVAGAENGAELTEAFREEVGALADEFIETGGIAETSLGYVIDRLKTMASETAEGEQSLADLQKLAKKTGGDFDELAEAYAGNTEGLKDLVKEHEDYLDTLKDEADAVDHTVKGAYKAAQDKITAQESIVKGLQDAEKVAVKAAEAEAAYAAAGVPELEAKAALIDDVQSNVDEATSSWEDYRDEETHALDPANFLKSIRERAASANIYAENLKIAQEQLSPAAYQYLVDQGIDFAPMLDSILSSDLVPTMEATFSTAAAAGNTAVEQGIDPDVSVDVDVTATTKKAESEVGKTEKKKRATTITAKADTKKANADIDKAAKKKRTATIDVKVDTAQAKRDLAAFTGRSRSLTITVNTKDRDGKKVD